MEYLKELNKLGSFQVKIDDNNRIQLVGQNAFYFTWIKKCEIESDIHSTLANYLRDDLFMDTIELIDIHESHIHKLLNMQDRANRYNELDMALYSIEKHEIYFVFKTCVENVKASRKFFVIKKNLKNGKMYITKTSYFDWIDKEYLKEIYGPLIEAI